MKLIDAKFIGIALKRIRKLAVTLCCVTLGLSVLNVLLTAYANGVTGGLPAPHISGVAPMLTLYIYLAPALLVFNALSWTRSRSDSDFFDALPLKKCTMVLSSVCAVMIACTATVILTLLASWLCYILIGVPFVTLYVPVLLAAYFAGMLLSAGCALIAMSITGTGFTNMVVTLLMMFLLRIVLMMCTFIVEQQAPIALPLELGVLLNPGMNLLTALFFTPLGLNNVVHSPGVNQLLMDPATIIYTFCLGGLYICLGCWLFQHRKSEMAGSNAPGNVLQHLYRCGITLPFVMLVACLLTLCLMEKEITRATITICILLMAVSLIIYLVYELMTTRSIRQLGRSLAVYPFILLAAAVFCAVSCGVSLWRLNVLPEQKQIRGVQLIAYDPEDLSYSDLSYTQMRSSAFIHQDEKIISLVEEALKNTAAVTKQEKKAGPYSNAQTVRVRRFGWDLVRNVKFTDLDYDRLTELLLENPEYRACLTALPPEEEIYQIRVEGIGDPGEARSIWENFRKEYENLPEEARQILLASYPQTGETVDEEFLYGGLTITLEGRNGLNLYNQQVFLTTATPETFNRYIRLANEYHRTAFNKDLQALQSCLAGEEAGEFEIQVDIHGIEPTKDQPLEGATIYIGEGSYYAEEGLTMENEWKPYLAYLQELLDTHQQEDAAADSSYLEVRLLDVYSDGYLSFEEWPVLRFNVSEEEARALYALRAE